MCSLSALLKGSSMTCLRVPKAALEGSKRLILSTRIGGQGDPHPARRAVRLHRGADCARVDSDVRCNPVDSIGSSTESRVSHSEPWAVSEQILGLSRLCKPWHMSNPFRYFNSSPEVIRLVVMMYVRYPLSLRNVEDLLAERGVDISHETVRF
jgi:hypothetical protein